MKISDYEQGKVIVESDAGDFTISFQSNDLTALETVSVFRVRRNAEAGDEFVAAPNTRSLGDLPVWRFRDMPTGMYFVRSNRDGETIYFAIRQGSNRVTLYTSLPEEWDED